MTKKRNKQKKNRRKSRSDSKNPMMISSGLIQYGGVSGNNQIVHRFFLKTVQTGLATDGAGTLSAVLALNNPSGSTDWTSLAGLFDSYRVRKVSVSWIPAIAPGSTTGIYRPLYVITDFDSVLSLTTGDTALQYDSTRMYDISKPFIHTVTNVPMTQNNGIVGWIDVANPIAQGTVQLLSTGLAVTLAYGSYVIEWDIQFRMRL